MGLANFGHSLDFLTILFYLRCTVTVACRELTENIWIKPTNKTAQKSKTDLFWVD